jgi:septal ring factor EnvC (AmiA/AmiB activator)
MSDSEKIQKFERQTRLSHKQSELLQKQLKEVKEELARTRKQTEKVEPKVPPRCTQCEGQLADSFL